MSFEGDSPSKFRILSAAKGPRDKWRVQEDQTAVVGNSLHFGFCQKLGVGGRAMECWFKGISSAFTSQPPPAVLPDYP